MASTQTGLSQPWTMTRHKALDKFDQLSRISKNNGATALGYL
jgi:hypothetical protein